MSTAGVGIEPETPTIQTTAPLAVDWIRLIPAGALTNAVALVIRKPLRGVLQLICGQDVSADFWASSCVVLIVMGPLFLVFTAAAGAESLASFVRRTVYLVSLGVIGACLVMGAAVMLSIPSQALARQRAAHIEADTRRPWADE